MSATLELRALRIGESFEVIGLEESYRNLRVVKINDGSIQIKGDISESNNDESRVWSSLGDHYFSPRTEVRRI